MKVSRNWLQNFFAEPLPKAETLAETLTFHAFEIDGIERLSNDDVLDVSVTPNRGHDCLSHRGLAAELSAILQLPLKAENDPLNKTPDLTKPANGVKVELKTPLAKRYIAGLITGVKIGPSPTWLKQSLEAIGQRSINNLVDATNLVMFNLGQPLHAFDFDKLAANNNHRTIAVRPAKAGETITTLDGRKYALDESMLVISDAVADKAIGIAGVKGGKAAEIDKSTTNILIEAANFDGVSVRKTAQKLKLRTDASARFEQVISSELAAYAMRQMVDLVESIAGGEIIGFVDQYPVPQTIKSVSVTLEKINQTLGIKLTNEEVARVFDRLALSHRKENDKFIITPPPWRLDLEIAADLVEEVARIIGYEKIPAVDLTVAALAATVNPAYYAAEKARTELTAQGYSEVLTSVFAESGERAVTNKIGGDRPYLRDSLLPGLKEALAKNIPNKDLLGLKEIKLFEIGTIWQGGEEKVMIGTISEKTEAVEKPLQPQAAEAYNDLPLSTATRYTPFSKYPYIVRDIAMWTPADTSEEKVRSILEKEAGDLCIKLSLFDRFEKDSRVSYGFRLIFQSFDRTLTDAEVGEIMERVYTAVKECGWEVR